MLIIPSRECILLQASECKEVFMVDPKTSAVLLKYHDDALLLPMLAHYKPAQQILGMQLDKTFITVWSGEAQVPELKISLAEAMSCLKVSSDSRLLYGGSASGNLHLWELPSGLLLRKRNVHAGAVLDVSEQPGGYLITVGVDCVKMWPMATLVIETETVVCCKCYQSVLSIKAAVLTPTGLLGVLSEKAVVVLQSDPHRPGKDFEVLQRYEFQFACVICASPTCFFVGDFQGSMTVVYHGQPSEEKELEFFVGETNPKGRTNPNTTSYAQSKGTPNMNTIDNTKGKTLCIVHPRRCRTLSSPSKHPLTSLAYVQTLQYLIAGNSEGEIMIWSNGVLKKSVKLFKSSIIGMTVIRKGDGRKVPQQAKIKPLHRFEMGKEGKCLILPAQMHRQGYWANQTNQHNSLKTDTWGDDYALIQVNDAGSKFKDNNVVIESQMAVVMEEMLKELRNPEKIMRREMEQMQREKQKLLEANLHYCRMLAEE